MARTPIRPFRTVLPILALLCSAAVSGARAGAAETLVVHEWGTATVLQDDAGVGIGRINVDDEPVPRFVHDAAPRTLARLNDLSERLDLGLKGCPEGLPAVTMRLETPVIYVHPGSSGTSLQMRVQVDFHGGWLTQFFPHAIATIPGHMNGDYFQFDPMTGATVSTLVWPDLTAGESTVPLTETADAVWLAPRRVSCANVRAGSEGERFLFYRGVAHCESPVHVTRSVDGALTVRPPPGQLGTARYCLVDIHADGSLAFRVVTGAGGIPVQAGPETFDADQYSPAQRATLRAILAGELTAAGLFADEAEALLNTWDQSYFHSPGLRLFFLLPRAWIDEVLPLTITPRAAIERVMVGRIELVSAHDRALLAAIAAGPTSNATWWDDFLAQRVYDEAKTNFRPGGLENLKQVALPGGLARLKLDVPADYAAYLGLGRFREAIIHQELASHPPVGLTAFARVYGIIPQAPQPGAAGPNGVSAAPR